MAFFEILLEVDVMFCTIKSIHVFSVSGGGQYLVRKWPIAQKYIVAEMTPPSPMAIPQYFKEAGNAFKGLANCREKTVQVQTIHESINQKIELSSHL